MESVGYCDKCGCPESRLMKPLRTFVTMVRPDCHDALVKHVQDMCAEAFIQDLLDWNTTWEFQIEKNPMTDWWCLYIVAEFEVWRQINVMRMRAWLEERCDKDELRNFPDFQDHAQC